MIASDFQNLLFKSAVSAMAVDGEIHDNEIIEIKSIIQQYPYFIDFEYEQSLNENISFIKSKGKLAINEFLEEVSRADLSEKQKMIMIEILLRVIESDNRIDDNEAKFINLVISKIKVDDEQLIFKFPKHINLFIGFGQYQSTYFDNDVKL